MMHLLAMASLAASTSLLGGSELLRVDPPNPRPPTSPCGFPGRPDSARKKRKRELEEKRARIKAGVPGSKLARKAARGRL